MVQIGIKMENKSDNSNNMKKFLILSFLAVFCLNSFSQVTVVGNGTGTATHPYHYHWIMRSSSDTVINNILGSASAPNSNNAVIEITIHYWLNSYDGTCKFYPIESVLGIDSLGLPMAFDTTKLTAVKVGYGQYRNIIFSAQYNSANVISIRVHPGGASKGVVDIYVKRIEI
jgi:hypothetical protein